MTPDAPRPDLDEAERWARSVANDPDEICAQAPLAALLAEYDRRGATMVELDVALADAHAEIARLRAAVDAVQKFCDDWCAPGDWHPFDQVRRVLRDALAAAPAPAREQADPADDR